MKNIRLIFSLLGKPLFADVKFLYDGAARGEAEKVWLSKSGTIVIASEDEPVYSEKDKPK